MRSRSTWAHAPGKWDTEIPLTTGNLPCSEALVRHPRVPLSRETRRSYRVGASSSRSTAAWTCQISRRKLIETDHAARASSKRFGASAASSFLTNHPGKSASVTATGGSSKQRLPASLDVGRPATGVGWGGSRNLAALLLAHGRWRHHRNAPDLLPMPVNHADALRAWLLKTGEREGVHIVPREPTDRFTAYATTASVARWPPSWGDAWAGHGGPSRQCQSEETVDWFQIDGDDYWLLTDQDRFNPIGGTTWLVWSAIAAGAVAGGCGADWGSSIAHSKSCRLRPAVCVGAI